MSIRAKLVTGFAIIIAFIALQSIITYYYLNQSASLVQQTLVRDFDNATTISKMAILGQQLRRYEKEYFIYANNPVKRKKYEEEWSDAYRQLQRLITGAREDNTGLWSQNDKLEFDKWQASMEDYHRGFTLVSENVDRGLIKGTLEANSRIQEAKNRFKVFLSGATAYGTRKLQAAKASGQQIDENFKFINNIVLVTSAGGLLLTVVLLVIIPGAISRPIKILTKAANTMSTGNLEQPVPLTTGSEFRDLADTLERMRVSQKTLMDRYRSNRS